MDLTEEDGLDTLCAGYNFGGMKKFMMDGSGQNIEVGEFAAACSARGRHHSGWYTHMLMLAGTKVFCVRSTHCKGQGGKHGCKSCSALVDHKGLTEAMRRAAIASAKSSSSSCYRIEVERKVALTRTIKRIRERNRRQARTILRLRKSLKSRSAVQNLTESAMRMDLRAVGLQLTNYAIEGERMGYEHQTALDLAANIVRNLSVHKNGKRYSARAKAFMGIIRTFGLGQAKYNMISDNMGLGHERSARKYAQSEEPGVFNASLTDESFAYLAKIYGDVMQRLGIKLGSIPCTAAEDETGINPQPQHDTMTDNVVGFCGKLCAKRCPLIGPCRKQCKDSHACTADGNYRIDMGRDYQTVIGEMSQSRVSTLARAIVVNPLCESLPRLACLWTGTCKTFCTKDYIIPCAMEIDWATMAQTSGTNNRTVDCTRV